MKASGAADAGAGLYYGGSAGGRRSSLGLGRARSLRQDTSPGLGGRRLSITANADESNVPEDEPAVTDARLDALGRTKTGLTVPDYDEVPELPQEDDESGDEEAPDARPRRGSVLDMFRDAFFGQGDEQSNRQSPKMQHLRARRTQVFEPTDMKRFQELDGLAGDRAKLLADPRLAPGEAVLALHKHALRAANASKIQHRTFGGKQVTPISRNYDLVKEEIQLEEGNSANKAISDRKGPSLHIAEWLEAGLQASGSDAVEGKRPLPPGYEIAKWSGSVPLVRHLKTGVILWPVRLDLTPLFEAIEGKSKTGISSSTTTVFHYSSTGGFHRLVAPPTYFRDDEETMSQYFAEEVWDRIESDLHHHNVPPVEGAPGLALMLIGSDPSKFDSREAVARAVYRTKHPRFGPGRVGHCVALQVPSDHCMAVAGKSHVHTVVLLPPCEVDEGSEDEQAVHRHGLQSRFVKWKARHGMRGRKEHASVAAQVRSQNLLDGLVDRATGEVTIEEGIEAPSSSGASARRPHLTSFDSNSGRARSQGSAGSGRNSAKSPQSSGSGRQQQEDEGDEEDQIRAKVLQLQKEQKLLENKIRHAEHSQAKVQAGRQAKFLATDEHRLRSLESRLAKCKLQLQEALRNLELYAETSEDIHKTSILASVAEEQGEGGEEGSSADAEANILTASGMPAPSKRERRRRLEALRRRRRRARAAGNAGLTLFSDSVQEVVQDVGDEYQMQSGDIFREVFGGNIEGVKAWVEDEDSDLNRHHPSIGWTPLHMAVSMGDPEMVTLILENSGDPGQATLEQGWCPVHLAVWKNSVDLLRLLLKRDDDSVKYKTKDGETPLFIAVQSSTANIRDDMVRELLKAHSDPNAKQKDEWSPLALAVVRNYQLEVKQLVQNRGNIFDPCPDSPGKTIWQASSRHPGLQDLIRSKLNSRDLHIVQKLGQGRA